MGGPKSKYAPDEILTVFFRPCIERIRKYTKGDYELILIDNGSTFGAEEIQKAADIYIRNETNLGFGKACNQGFRAAKGEWIVCMNNDVYVYEGWLESLMQTFEVNPECGFSMPALLNQKDAVNAYEANKIEDIKPYLKSNRDRYGRTTFGSLWLTKKSILDAVKIPIKYGDKDDVAYFDENFILGFREDKDLFLRVEKELKLIPLKTHNTRVFHQGNTTIAKIEGWREATQKNREYFYQKHDCNEDQVKNGTVLKDKMVNYQEGVERKKILPEVKPAETEKYWRDDMLSGVNHPESLPIPVRDDYLLQDGVKKPIKHKKIAILTVFAGADPGFALHVGTYARAKMMAEKGIDFDLLVQTNFEIDENDKSLQPLLPYIKKIVPHIRLRKWAQDQDQVKTNAETLKVELLKILAPYDIVITHDLIYQEAYIAHNIAIHDIAPKLPHVKWFHWIHSGPKFPRVEKDWPRELLHRLPPNSKIVYMNETDALRIAESYGTTLDNVRVVYNTKDVGDFFDFTDEAKRLIRDNDILSADIIQTFPFSTPRHEGKQVRKVIRLFGSIKKNGYSVKLILCNAHGNRHAEMVEELRKYGMKNGLTEKDMIITSEQGFDRGVPRRTVANLFQISDLFIFPSTSEVCPNVLLEAAVAGNFLVINESLPCLKEFTGTKALNNWGFSSIYSTVNFPNEEAEVRWYLEVARVITAELTKERSYHTKKFAYRHYNFKYIFDKQFLPMISEI